MARSSLTVESAAMLTWCTAEGLEGVSGRVSRSDAAPEGGDAMARRPSLADLRFVTLYRMARVMAPEGGRVRNEIKGGGVRPGQAEHDHVCRSTKSTSWKSILDEPVWYECLRVAISIAGMNSSSSRFMIFKHK